MWLSYLSSYSLTNAHDAKSPLLNGPQPLPLEPRLPAGWLTLGNPNSALPSLVVYLLAQSPYTLDQSFHLVWYPDGWPNWPCIQLSTFIPCPMAVTWSDTRMCGPIGIVSSSLPSYPAQWSLLGLIPGCVAQLALYLAQYLYTLVTSANVGASTIPRTLPALIAPRRDHGPGPPLRPRVQCWWLPNCLWLLRGSLIQLARPLQPFLSTLRRAQLIQLQGWSPPNPTPPSIANSPSFWPSPLTKPQNLCATIHTIGRAPLFLLPLPSTSPISVCVHSLFFPLIQI